MKGIRIGDILQSSRLSLLSLDEKAPLDFWLNCPSCETGLKQICRLIGGERVGTRGYGSAQRDSNIGTGAIRIGLCENCGYMGYMDRPSSAWMREFYSREWDKAFPRTIADIQRATVLPGKGVKQSRYLAASLIEKIKPDKEKPVCEIGSGYGEVLRYFNDAGFKDLIGIENSKHRAELVNQALGFNVLHGGFEDQEVQEQLSKYKSIGLFFSHHALEHVYDPAETLAKISDLQNEGDFLILSLPNADGEHINYALLYLVHLHSFTKESLEILLNKNGYEIVADNSPDDSNIVIAAQKTQSPRPRFKVRQDYFDTISRRIRKGLALDEIKKPVWHTLHWEQGSERDMARATELGSGFLSKIIWYFKNKIAYIRSRFLKRFTSGYTMLVFPERTDSEYFEIRFPGKIIFLIK